MIDLALGDSAIRVIPPSHGMGGCMQVGEVTSVSEKVITITVQVDIPRQMEFSREDGIDLNGLGTFIIPLKGVF